MPVPSVASPSIPSISAELAQAPSPSEKANSSIVARRKPRPGARREIASIRLVLPTPFAPVSTIGPGPIKLDLCSMIAAEISSASGDE